jgi:hypothetical protein
MRKWNVSKIQLELQPGILSILERDYATVYDYDDLGYASTNR